MHTPSLPSSSPPLSAPHSHNLHHQVTITMSPPPLHIVTITMSPHQHTMSPSPHHYHHITITTPSPPPPHHHHVTTTTTTPSPCHHHHITTTTTPSPCHHYTTTICSHQYSFHVRVLEGITCTCGVVYIAAIQTDQCLISLLIHCFVVYSCRDYLPLLRSV